MRGVGKTVLLDTFKPLAISHGWHWVAHLDSSGGEFTVQEIVEESKRLLPKPFGNSHTNQMLSTLSDMGLIYKNRWGRYSFAVPLFDRFIQRQSEAIEPQPDD